MCSLGPSSFRLKTRVEAAGDAEVKTAGKKEYKKKKECRVRLVVVMKLGGIDCTDHTK